MADFEYVRSPTGELSGASLVTQTESALTALSDAVISAEQAASAAQTASQTAAEQAQAAAESASTASSAAQTATQDAATALTTAQTASETAGSALSTAQGAVTTAGEAVTAATNAQTAAEGAQSAAEGAASDAHDAAEDAATAAGTAQTALETANAATTTAGQAASNASAAVTTAGQASTTAGNALALAQNAVMLSGAQSVAGVKTFTDSPLVPTPADSDNSQKAASTAFVAGEIAEKTVRYDVVQTLTAAQKAQALANIGGQPLLSGIDSWELLAELVKGGQAERFWPVGSTIQTTWRDTAAGVTYPHYLHVADYRDVELEGGQTARAMIVQAHNAHPYAVQFSHQRAFLKCPNGLAAGSYYFTFESSWSTNVQAGDVVCFTTTVAVPAGGRVSGCYGAPDQAKSNWRIYTHSADGKTILETITPTTNPVTPTGTNLGTLHATTRDSDLNCAHEMAYGCNQYLISAYRQWLTSSSGVGLWWTPQDGWDIAPNELASKPGYLTGFEQEFLDVLLPAKVVTLKNTVTFDGSADVSYDKFWLPSLEELYITPQAAGEGAALEYWRRVNGTPTKWSQGGTYDLLKHFAEENTTSAQTVRLRSALRGNAYGAWHVNSSGGVSSGGNVAYYAYRGAPLAAIGKI